MKLLMSITMSLFFSMQAMTNKTYQTHIAKINITIDNLRGENSEKNKEIFAKYWINNLLRSKNYNELTEIVKFTANLIHTEDLHTQIDGEIFLSELSRQLRDGLQKKSINKSDFQFKKLINELHKVHYNINIGMSDTEKIMYHLEKGNIEYLWQRLGNRIHQFKGYLWAILTILLTIIPLLLFAKPLIAMFNRYKSIIIKLILQTMKRTTLFTIYLFMGLAYSQSQNLSESFYGSYYNGDVKVYKLKEGGSEIGQSIYFSRTNKRVKAKYFACSENGKSVYERYLDFAKNTRIVSVFSGAYTTGNNYSLPMGLTVDNGTVVSRDVDDKMDALVIIEKVGGIRIYDLDAGKNLYLKSLNSQIDPRTSSGKLQLFSWSNAESATIFQTNLLVYKNTLKFGDVPQTAERRILAICEYGNNIEHILFNIEKSRSLTEIARNIFSLLQNKGYSVVGMINLDTGMMNAFEMYDYSGNKFLFEGNTSLSRVSNLLVYYYE